MKFKANNLKVFVSELEFFCLCHNINPPASYKTRGVDNSIIIRVDDVFSKQIDESSDFIKNKSKRYFSSRLNFGYASYQLKSKSDLGNLHLV